MEIAIKKPVNVNFIPYTEKIYGIEFIGEIEDRRNAWLYFEGKLTKELKNLGFQVAPY